MELFRVRLNCVDHYQSPPTRFDPRIQGDDAASRGYDHLEVPVIRVYGSTETGQKVCAHIHGVFPYLYVEYSGALSLDKVEPYMRMLRVSIDRALAAGRARVGVGRKSTEKFVARITLVKGVPFYGYHVGYRYYFKIYMLSPLVMSKLSDLLLQGAIMGTVLQPYEAHLQYILQWMVDYNLYGCGYINCRRAFFREPVPEYSVVEGSAHLWHDESIPEEPLGDQLPGRIRDEPEQLRSDKLHYQGELEDDASKDTDEIEDWDDILPPPNQALKYRWVHHRDKPVQPVPKENLRGGKFRGKLPGAFFRGGSLPRVSHCSIEVDICAQDILNRLEIKQRNLHHDFVERLNPNPLDEKLVHSMADLWRDETRRRKSRMINPDFGSSPFPPEVLISMSAGSRDPQGEWMQEWEYLHKIKRIIAEEKKGGSEFDDFVEKAPFVAPKAERGRGRGRGRGASGTSVERSPFGVSKARGRGNGTLDAFVTRTPMGASKARGSGTLDSFVKRSPFSTSAVDKRGGSAGFFAEKTPFVEKSFIEKSFVEKPPLVKKPFVEKSFVGGSPFIERSPFDTSIKEGDGARPSFDTFIEKSPFEASIKTTFEAVEDFYPELDLTYVPEVENKVAEDKDIIVETQISSDEESCEAAEDEGVDVEETQISNEESRKRAKGKGIDVDETQISNEESRRRAKGKGINVDETQVSSDDDLCNSEDETLQIKLPEIFGSQYGNDKKPRRLSNMITQTTQVRFSSTKIPGRTPLNPPEVDDYQSGGYSSFPAYLASKRPRPSNSSSNSTRDEDNKRQRNYERPSNQRNDLMSMVGDNMARDFPVANKFLLFGEPPLDADEVTSSMQSFGLPPVIYQDAYYGKESDVPKRTREWAGREFKLKSLTVPFLRDFDPSAFAALAFRDKPATNTGIDIEERRRKCSIRNWEIAEPPPTAAEVIEWVENEDRHKHSARARRKAESSQIDEPTQRNKYVQRQKTPNVQHETQYMSTMSLEIHVNTRGDFVPDPEEDAVQCIFWCLQSNDDLQSERPLVGIVVLGEGMRLKISKQVAAEVQEETSEFDLFIRIVEIVRRHDADILTGYEVHNSSWGYLVERARLKYGYDLCGELSRVKFQSGRPGGEWGSKMTSKIEVAGRHTINIWRAMRSELNLLQYTMESVVFHLLHRRIPHFAWRDLTIWYTNGRPRDLTKVLLYYVSRVQLDLEILEQNELIYRTSEQARLLGVDFFSVFSRGSQFKVESLMFRIAKPENFLLISPSKKQVGEQDALQCLPLVMEPQSAFYTSPVLVLDFQSLYPSIMIAYNYCYSTFLGRVDNWRGRSKMGFTDYQRKRGLVELLEDQINVAPNGMMYIKPEIRRSLLAKMLGEILETRVMVKNGMKFDQDDKTLQMLLNNRQLALKLIANVTYGYTSASFSGRMPCSEIADSIVQTARETLERAIALIHSNRLWDAEVVYGDTDSLFVHLSGRTKDQAFQIGKEIVDEVTKMNPRPVKLKFEKVYLPCVLLAKKRYVGFKYETADQQEPEFDAKGIETVRRDGTPAEQKIEEQALKILFRTSDLSQVKRFFQEQCRKIMKGSVSIQDFCFAKEVRLGEYSGKGVLPPGALISTKRMLRDHRTEPQYGERVPYVVIAGAPGARLADRSVPPETLLHSDHRELDAEYYITKNIIPALERIFNLVGANVRNWYDEMPKIRRIRRIDDTKPGPKNMRTLESYMKSSSCPVCGRKIMRSAPLCVRCLANRPGTLLTLQTRLNGVEKKVRDLESACRQCSGFAWTEDVKCDSLDCPVFYSRVRQKAKLKTEQASLTPVMKLLQDLQW